MAKNRQSSSARPPPSTPRLARAKNASGYQFMCATMPFLVLFAYFLYLAAVRPAIYNQNNNNGNWKDTGAIIPLMDMMGCFLAFLGLFSLLGVYLAIFIPKRRQLMKSYLSEGKVCMGDVFYEDSSPKFSFSKYAYCMYAHPQRPKEWLVRKRVRCFQHFTRERVSILVLPYYPFSGQPKSDVEMDLAASEQARRDTQKVLYCVYVWIVFLAVAPIFLLRQMGQIEDDYDDPKRGWTIYLVCVFGIIPLLAFGGNYLRWRLHRHWVLNRGIVIELTKPAAGETSVRVAQGDNACFSLNCMNYTAMEDTEEGKGAASPTRTEVSQSTAYNSVYMA